MERRGNPRKILRRKTLKDFVDEGYVEGEGAGKIQNDWFWAWIFLH